MLAAEAHGIAAPQPGIKQNVAPHALARADGPAFVVGLGIGFRPNREACAFPALGVGDALGGIECDVLRGLRPLEQPAHGVEKIARLRRRCSATVAARHHVGMRDRAIGLIARRFNNLLEMVLAVAARGLR